MLKKLDDWIQASMYWFEDHPRAHTVCWWICAFLFGSIGAFAFMVAWHVSALLYFWLIGSTLVVAGEVFSFVIFPVGCGFTTLGVFLLLKRWINRSFSTAKIEIKR